MNRAARVRFRVVGLGRAGRSLIAALAHSGWEYLGGYGRADDPSDAGAGVEAVFLTVPDDAIASTARAITPTSAVLIHFSGAKTLDVLEPHRRRASVHPLVSLPDPETGAQRLRAGATFAVAGNPLAADLVATLKGKAIEVPEEHRTLYHAAAAIAANHLVTVCAQVERIADHIGVPVDLYWELMDSTMGNVIRVGPDRALTGPAARGDTKTVESHVRALTELGPDEVTLYRVLAEATARLGRTRERASNAEPG